MVEHSRLLPAVLRAKVEEGLRYGRLLDQVGASGGPDEQAITIDRQIVAEVVADDGAAAGQTLDRLPAARLVTIDHDAAPAFGEVVVATVARFADDELRIGPSQGVAPKGAM